MKHKRLSAALLLAGSVHWLAYRNVDPELRGQVWNLTGHALSTLAIGWLAYVYRASPAVVIVAALVAAWTAQVAFCSGWWLVERWPRVAGESLCSERLGFPLGTLGCVAALLVAAHLSKGRP